MERVARVHAVLGHPAILYGLRNLQKTCFMMVSCLTRLNMTQAAVATAAETQPWPAQGVPLSQEEVPEPAPPPAGLTRAPQALFPGAPPNPLPSRQGQLVLRLQR
jgi:hypothetical protein